jgi:hypothetical protein
MINFSINSARVYFLVVDEFAVLVYLLREYYLLQNRDYYILIHEIYSGNEDVRQIKETS